MRVFTTVSFLNKIWLLSATLLLASSIASAAPEDISAVDIDTYATEASEAATADADANIYFDSEDIVTLDVSEVADALVIAQPTNTPDVGTEQTEPGVENDSFSTESDLALKVANGLPSNDNRVGALVAFAGAEFKSYGTAVAICTNLGGTVLLTAMHVVDDPAITEIRFFPQQLVRWTDLNDTSKFYSVTQVDSLSLVRPFFLTGFGRGRADGIQMLKSPSKMIYTDGRMINLAMQPPHVIPPYNPSHPYQYGVLVGYGPAVAGQVWPLRRTYGFLTYKEYLDPTYLYYNAAATFWMPGIPSASGPLQSGASQNAIPGDSGGPIFGLGASLELYGMIFAIEDHTDWIPPIFRNYAFNTSNDVEGTGTDDIRSWIVTKANAAVPLCMDNVIVQ